MNDICIRAIEESGLFKVHVAVGTELVETARITHQTSATATAALGRSLLAGVLLRNKLKGEDESLTLIIDGDGPGGKIVVTGRNNGYVKGYIDNPSADLPTRGSDGKLDVRGIVGTAGTLTVTMDLGLREAYTGKVALVSGEIGEDVAQYLSLGGGPGCIRQRRFVRACGGRVYRRSAAGRIGIADPRTRDHA